MKHRIYQKRLVEFLGACNGVSLIRRADCANDARELPWNEPYTAPSTDLRKTDAARKQNHDRKRALKCEKYTGGPPGLRMHNGFIPQKSFTEKG